MCLIFWSSSSDRLFIEIPGRACSSLAEHRTAAERRVRGEARRLAEPAGAAAPRTALLPRGALLSLLHAALPSLFS